MWYSTPFTERLVSIAISSLFCFRNDSSRISCEFVRAMIVGCAEGLCVSLPGKFLLDHKPLKWICGYLVLAFLFLLDFRSQHYVQLYGVSSRELYFSRLKVKELLSLLLLGGDQSPILHKRIGYDIFCYHIIMYV